MKQILCALLTLTFAGCANIPPVTLYYQLPKTLLNVTATQSLLCTENKDAAGKVIGYTPHSNSKVDLKESYTADTSRHAIPVNFSEFDGFWNDAEIIANITPDGRLNSVNGSSTGLGKIILETTIKAAGAAGILKALPHDSELTPKDINTPCKVFVMLHKDKPQTYVRTQTFDLSKVSSLPLTLTAPGNAPEYFHDLLPQITIQTKINESQIYIKDPKVINAHKSVQRISCDNCDQYPHVTLPVQKLATSVASEQRRNSDGFLEKPSEISENSYLFPDATNTFNVPLFNKSVFGKLAVNLELGDASDIKKISYTSSDNASFGESLKNLSEALTQKTEYEKLKDANSLAFEQQRQLACQSDPSKDTCK